MTNLREEDGQRDRIGEVRSKVGNEEADTDEGLSRVGIDEMAALEIYPPPKELFTGNVVEDPRIFPG